MEDTLIMTVRVTIDGGRTPAERELFRGVMHSNQLYGAVQAAVERFLHRFITRPYETELNVTVTELPNV